MPAPTETSSRSLDQWQLARLSGMVLDIPPRVRLLLLIAAVTGLGLVVMQSLVGRQPGISVREAAAELSLVPNTASTLVSKLAADGLLIRSVDTDDRRVGRLKLTAPAQRIGALSSTGASRSSPSAAPSAFS